MGRSPNLDAPIRVRAGALRFIRLLAKSHRWRLVDTVDVLVRGWHMLTPEQQERAKRFDVPATTGPPRTSREP